MDTFLPSSDRFRAVFRRMQCLGVLAIWFSLGVTGFAGGEWQNSLKPVGTPGREIVLVKDGQAARPIRLTANATDVEKFAAAELQHWIEQITTARPAITTSRGQPSVSLETDAALGDEGYRIAIEGDDLVLAGGTRRGIMNAVYALLEEDLGCRFYTNESIKLPAGNTLSVRPVERSFVPKLRLRDPFYTTVFNETWSVRNRTNAPHAVVPEEHGGHIDYDGLFVHTHAKLLPADEYFQEHPEYFALNAAGQRYPNSFARPIRTWPESLRKRAAQAEKESAYGNRQRFEERQPGHQICYCDRCKRIRADEGSDIGCQLVLVNAVADAVEKKYPHVTVDTLAYLETSRPPKHMRPRANVVIRLCNDRDGAWTHPFTPAENCAIATPDGGLVEDS